MKTTYLINKVCKDGSLALETASAAEWFAVVKSNKGLSKEKRRYFIYDCIEEGVNIDRVVIEVTQDEYYKWNSEHTLSERNRKLKNNFLFLSLDVSNPSCLNITLADCIQEENDFEDMILGEMFIESLSTSLSDWKPWALDLLNMYIDGNKKGCTSEISKKLSVSEVTVRKYKKKFEEFIKNF